MDENRKLYDKRQIRKAPSFFNALKDEDGFDYNSDNQRPDYRIRKERDIDNEGKFIQQMVFQPLNLNNNLVGCFNYTFCKEDEDLKRSTL